MKSLACLGNVNSRCMLCNKSSNEDLVIVHSKGLNTLKDLSIRWERLPNSVCANNPYEEFKNVRNRIEGNSNFFIFHIA